MSESKPVVFLALPHYGSLSPGTLAAVITASRHVQPLINFEYASLLAYNFNRLWAECANLHRKPGAPVPTHFAMLHSDLAPDPGWLDVLLDETERLDADVVSAVVPIKDHRGLTSTGLLERQTEQLRRFTMKEIFELPETFDAAGAGFPDRALMVNTGCWLARLDRPWVADFPGFAVLDGISRLPDGRLVAMVMPEDWNFSSWLAARKARVFATRKVAVEHLGQQAFRSDSSWGSWETDIGDDVLRGLPARGDAAEGWTTPVELSWLTERARRAGRVVEVGAWHGRSTAALAAGCKGVVVAVDHFRGSPGDRSPTLADAERSGAGARARDAFRKNLADALLAGKVRLIEADSRDAARQLSAEGNAFDLVFLDAAHDEESVRADIAAWSPLLAPGGLFSGHDRHLPGVRAAIDDLLPGWRPAAGTIWEVTV